MTTTFKNMTPDEKRAHIIKDITGALDETIESTRVAALNQMTLVGQLTQTVDFDSNITKQPYTDLPNAGQTNFTIGSLEVQGDIKTTIVELVDETVEDINPTVGVRSCLTTLLGQSMAKDVEKDFVDSIKADATIGNPAGGGATWEGIKAILGNMGASVFNTVGPIVIAVSLSSYLNLVGTDEIGDAKQFLKEKVRLVVSEHITDSEVIAFHTHGVAGGFVPRTIEFNREGSKNLTVMIGSYRSGYAWDTKYVRYVR